MSLRSLLFVACSTLLAFLMASAMNSAPPSPGGLAIAKVAKPNTGAASSGSL
jgi:hypothetical protein